MPNKNFQVVQITPDHPGRRRALHLAMGARPSPTGGDAPEVRSITKLVSTSGRAIDLLFAAVAEGKFLTAAAALESPGHSALVLAPSQLRDPWHRTALAAALRSLQAKAWQRGLRLLQALVPCQGTGLPEVLHAAGFRYLTRLLYLRVAADGEPPREGRLPVEWEAYSPRSEALFLQVLEETYLDSRDCPGLAGLRAVSDVLSGHRATGEHDPALWWVGRVEGRPAGILLLSRLPAQESVEIVYIGVIPAFRGRGLADALLAKAWILTRQEGVKYVTLAVDNGNDFARRMYDRWGFESCGARDAWIASCGNHEP